MADRPGKTMRQGQSGLLVALFFSFCATCGPAEAGSGPRWHRLALEHRPDDPDLGHVEEGAWRTTTGQYSGEGLTARPGKPAQVVLDVPPKSVLRFYAVTYHEDRPAEAAETPATLRLSLDGTEIFTSEQTSHLKSRGAWHSVVLPEAGLRGAEFELSLEGVATHGTLFAPTFGPAQVGTYAERPWGKSRPNIVVFLADTFRADNLSIYGGEHGQAPNVDRLVAESITFRQAWSPAAWTLPAQASMMTGVYPRQHGAVRNRLPIESSLTTLAELLAQRGYRTGAVTDSGFVSAKFGFDQGFQWYEENSDRDFVHTLDSAKAFLEEDDGRPCFLFVQTYRTHDPYLTGIESDDSRWKDLLRELDGDEDPDLALLARASELRELYLEGVSGFDQLFGPWFEEIETGGALTNGFFFFLSDHGEAFGEHEDMKHGGLLWEEKIRIPFVVHGPGLEPGLREEAVSLVDLPATVAELVGLEALPDWVGRSVLSEQPSARAILAFGEELTRYPPHLALIERERKIMVRHNAEALGEARLERAFDLAQDPGELQDLKDDDLGWPQALCHRRAPEIELFSVPLARPSEMVLERDMERQLRELGY